MRKLILIILLLNFYFVQAQRTVRTNEIGFHLGGGNYDYIQMVNGTSSMKPSNFPAPDSLANMEYSQNGFIGNFPIGLNFTHWNISSNHPEMDHGFSVAFGYAGRVVNSESWTTIDSITYDTISVQSTGAKYPVDSIITDRYMMDTRAGIIRLAAGYHFRFRREIFDIVAGPDLVFQRFLGQNHRYSYNQFGTSTMPQSLTDANAESPVMNEAVTSSRKESMRHFSGGIQFPMEVRFHRRETETSDALIQPGAIGMFGLQLTPAVYYTAFNGVDQVYGAFSASINWTFQF